MKIIHICIVSVFYGLKLILMCEKVSLNIYLNIANSFHYIGSILLDSFLQCHFVKHLNEDNIYCIVTIPFEEK